MNLETKVSKGRSGWQAVTQIDLPAVEENEHAYSASEGPGKAVLEITTSKPSSGGVATSAGVYFLAPGSRRSAYGSNAPYKEGGGDYHRNVRHEKLRCTEKTITTFHEESLKLLPNMLPDVAKHYGFDDVDGMLGLAKAA